jgi:hypothetical protein
MTAFEASPFMPTIVFPPPQHHLAHVNQPKSVTVTEIHHVVFTTNIPVNRMAKRLIHDSAIYALGFNRRNSGSVLGD